jgi:hypothetical protein
MDEPTNTLNVAAGRRSDGSVAFEQVVVDSLGSGRYRLKQSPGLVLGLAAGDIFELTSDGKPNVLKRGGNICVQIFHSKKQSQFEPSLTRQLEQLGGRLDGRASREVVYTIPVSVGFVAVEEVLRELVSNFPRVEWFYGNVYDPDDGVTPLNWW